MYSLEVFKETTGCPSFHVRVMLNKVILRLSRFELAIACLLKRKV